LKLRRTWVRAGFNLRDVLAEPNEAATVAALAKAIESLLHAYRQSSISHPRSF
jgi:hypothetical protein